jgi:hypothetical protein
MGLRTSTRLKGDEEMGKHLLLVAANVVAITLGATAHAGTLLFSYADTGGVSFTYEQSSTPTPTSYSPNFANSVPIWDFQGNIGPYSSMSYFTTAASGGFGTPDGLVNGGGSQIFAGTVSNPVFTPGVFNIDEVLAQQTGTLAISAVPEPASWAMMLVGLGGLGGMIRSRRRLGVIAA